MGCGKIKPINEIKGLAHFINSHGLLIRCTVQ